MKLRTSVIALALVTGIGTSASAATFNGTFWDAPANEFNPEGAFIGDASGPGMQNAIDYALAQASPTATFTSTSINYGDGPGWGIGSLSDFLNADAGSIIGTNPSSIQESVIRITGVASFVNGQQYTVTSDDGFRLIVDGSILSEFGGLRGPNNSTSATWTGATGNYGFTLWYYEGNVTQAQLQANLTPAPIPVPAAGVLLLSALGGLSLARRRKKAS